MGRDPGCWTACSEWKEGASADLRSPECPLTLGGVIGVCAPRISPFSRSVHSRAWGLQGNPERAPADLRSAFEAPWSAEGGLVSLMLSWVDKNGPFRLVNL